MVFRPKKYLGSIEDWDVAESMLTHALDQFCSENNSKWELNPEDGAFYGPKIDIKIFDALKRKHQLATVQLDFQLPQRFNLKYTKDNKEEVPVIIHRAILGSLERCVAILCESFGGKWPFWLSPRQVKIVPVGKAFDAYAKDLASVRPYDYILKVTFFSNSMPLALKQKLMRTKLTLSTNVSETLKPNSGTLFSLSVPKNKVRNNGLLTSFKTTFRKRNRRRTNKRHSATRCTQVRLRQGGAYATSQ